MCIGSFNSQYDTVWIAVSSFNENRIRLVLCCSALDTSSSQAKWACGCISLTTACRTAKIFSLRRPGKQVLRWGPLQLVPPCCILNDTAAGKPMVVHPRARALAAQPSTDSADWNYCIDSQPDFAQRCISASKRRAWVAYRARGSKSANYQFVSGVSRDVNLVCVETYSPWTEDGGTVPSGRCEFAIASCWPTTTTRTT